jgi:hypothetical protein
MESSKKSCSGLGGSTFEDEGEFVEEGFDDFEVLLQHLFVEHQAFRGLSFHHYRNYTSIFSIN